MRETTKNRIQAWLPWLIMVALAAVALLATAPFLDASLYHGSDLGYHLRRIENIAIGLSRGIFPVRIQSDWLSGYGYAAGVFYGDVLLYFPAALRLLGVPVNQCYMLYLLGINALTVFGGYYVARRMAAPRTAAFTAATLYTFSTYRLCNITTRAALGEYTALAFLPLAAIGLWQCICPPAEKHRLPAWLLLAVGLSGVLQSHLLSFEMTVLCLCVLALALWRHTFTRAALQRIGGAAGVFCLLNVGYLVPLFDYYFTGKFQINQPGGTEPIQANGALWGQLLGIDYVVGAGQQENLVPQMELSPGTALLLAAGLGVVVCIVMLVRRRGKQAWPLAVLLAAGALVLWLASNTFPWDVLYNTGDSARKLVGSLQFPWRFLGVATLLMAATVALAVARLPRRARIAAAALLCVTAAVCAQVQFGQYTHTAAKESYTAGTEEPFWEQTCGHYLPAENGAVDLNKLTPNPTWDGGVALSDYGKDGTSCTFTASNTADIPAGVRLPLLWYKGYTAHDVATGETIPMACAANNVLEVEVPAGYSGTVRVYFTEQWYWRVAEVVSDITILVLVWVMMDAAFRKKRGKTKQKRKNTEKGEE